MLHEKFQNHRTLGSGEDFKRFLPYIWHCGNRIVLYLYIDSAFIGTPGVLLFTLKMYIYHRLKATYN